MKMEMKVKVNMSEQQIRDALNPSEWSDKLCLDILKKIVDRLHRPVKQPQVAPAVKKRKYTKRKKKTKVKTQGKKIKSSKKPKVAVRKPHIAKLHKVAKQLQEDDFSRKPYHRYISQAARVIKNVKLGKKRGKFRRFLENGR